MSARGASVVHAPGSAALRIPPLLEALRSAFHSVDTGFEGVIPLSALRIALTRAGAASLATPASIAQLEAEASASGTVGFVEFVALALAGRSFDDADVIAGSGPQFATFHEERLDDSSQLRDADEGPDESIIEFLNQLENHRLQMEFAGNFEEAARCLDKLAEIRTAEEQRRIIAVRTRHAKMKDAVAKAQAIQFRDFNATWDRYLNEYDAMATLFVTKMQKTHGEHLRKFQEDLHQELVKKPIKFGKEILDWRSREAVLVKMEKYGEAARIKATADDLERQFRARVDEERLQTFSQREVKFRSHQRAELEALLTRFNSRRDEHVKQRDNDLKRLLQRNKNVLAIIDTRNANEERQTTHAIRTSLMAPKSSLRREPLDTGKKSKSGPSEASLAASANHRAASIASPTNMFSPPRKADPPRTR